MSRKYPQADIKILYGRAAARCAFPSCRQLLVLERTATDETKQIGKIAHIIAHSEQGPRSDISYPSDKLDAYENWILLCPTCHDTVDAQEGKYDIQTLRDLKKAHEKWVRETLSDAMSQISFAELDIARQGIVRQGTKPVSEFKVIPPDEKIIKNQLSDSTRKLLIMGLMQSNEVKHYMLEMEKIDEGFVEKLVSGFKEKYLELSGDKQLRGDAIFEILLNFACSHASDFPSRAAGLALLAHLFETCEVFEN